MPSEETCQRSSLVGQSGETLWYDRKIRWMCVRFNVVRHCPDMREREAYALAASDSMRPEQSPGWRSLVSKDSSRSVFPADFREARPLLPSS